MTKLCFKCKEPIPDNRYQTTYINAKHKFCSTKCVNQHNHDLQAKARDLIRFAKPRFCLHCGKKLKNKPKVKTAKFCKPQHCHAYTATERKRRQRERTKAQ